MTDDNMAYTFSEFLEDIPLNRKEVVSNLLVSRIQKLSTLVDAPDIQIHCDHSICGGKRTYSSTDDSSRQLRNGANCFFLKYQCSNCKITNKIYAIQIVSSIKQETNTLRKIGEFPPYNPTIPSKLISLFRADRELFIKGGKCEPQGLGIGAFIYYRRVVESQRNIIFKEIIKVASKNEGASNLVERLEQAINEKQFTKSLELAKDAKPSSLHIDGHNPIKILYSTLSVGVHNLSDEECLKKAANIRVVLSELSRRIVHILEEQSDISRAVSELTNG